MIQRRHLIRAAALSLAIGSIACATQPSYEPPSRVVLVEGAGEHLERQADGSLEDTVAAPTAKVFQALKVSFQGLGLQLNVVDPAVLTVGTQNQRFIRRFNSAALSHYFNCGNSITGARADNWYVYVTVTSHVLPSSVGSKVSTLVQAVTIDPSGGGGDRLGCGSTGALEEDIADGVRSALAHMR